MEIKPNLGVTRDPTSEGWYYDECYYGTVCDALAMGVLGFCGCGVPAQALDLIVRCMARPDPAYPTILDRENMIAQVKAEPEIAAYIIMYLLSEKGLTDHGSSVPGWLTENGEEFIKLYEGETA